MHALILCLLMSTPSQAADLFVHVQRVEGNAAPTVLSSRWAQVTEGPLADEIGPLLAPVRAELDRAAAEMNEAEVGDAFRLEHRDRDLHLVVRLEQRPDAYARLESLLLEDESLLALLPETGAPMPVEPAPVENLGGPRP